MDRNSLKRIETENVIDRMEQANLIGDKIYTLIQSEKKFVN